MSTIQRLTLWFIATVAGCAIGYWLVLVLGLA